MTHEEMERAVQVLLDSQPVAFSNLKWRREEHLILRKNRHRSFHSQKTTDELLQTLTENVERMRLEIREAIEKLLVANAVTRDLAQQIGQEGRLYRQR